MRISLADKGGKFFTNGRDLVRIVLISSRGCILVCEIDFQNFVKCLSQPDLGQGQLASIRQQSNSCVRDLTRPRVVLFKVLLTLLSSG